MTCYDHVWLALGLDRGVAMIPVNVYRVIAVEEYIQVICSWCDWSQQVQPVVRGGDEVLISMFF